MSSAPNILQNLELRKNCTNVRVSTPPRPFWRWWFVRHTNYDRLSWHKTVRFLLLPTVTSSPIGHAIEVHCDQLDGDVFQSRVLFSSNVQWGGPHRRCQEKSHRFVGFWWVLRQLRHNTHQKRPKRWDFAWHLQSGPPPLDIGLRYLSIACPLAQCAGKMQTAHHDRSLPPPTPYLARFHPQLWRCFLDQSWQDQSWQDWSRKHRHSCEWNRARDAVVGVTTETLPRTSARACPSCFKGIP